MAVEIVDEGDEFADAAVATFQVEADEDVAFAEVVDLRGDVRAFAASSEA